MISRSFLTLGGGPELQVRWRAHGRATAARRTVRRKRASEWWRPRVRGPPANYCFILMKRRRSRLGGRGGRTVCARPLVAPSSSPSRSRSSSSPSPPPPPHPKPPRPRRLRSRCRRRWTRRRREAGRRVWWGDGGGPGVRWSAAALVVRSDALFRVSPPSPPPPHTPRNDTTRGPAPRDRRVINICARPLHRAPISPPHAKKRCVHASARSTRSGGGDATTVRPSSSSPSPPPPPPRPGHTVGGAARAVRRTGPAESPAAETTTSCTMTAGARVHRTCRVPLPSPNTCRRRRRCYQCDRCC